VKLNIAVALKAPVVTFVASVGTSFANKLTFLAAISLVVQTKRLASTVELIVNASPPEALATETPR